VERIKSSQQKLTFWGWFCWGDEKRNSVILCQFNCWVVCLLKKKRKTYERKKMKKKRLKQKKIVVLSCFKFCWDSFLILWKTPSFSPHCCWNYYLLLYILLREKKWAGQPYKFPSHAHLLILWCPLLKEKKRFLLCAPTLIACFKVLRHNTKINKQTNKNHNVEKKKTKTVFKTAIVIAVKKNYEN